MVRTTGPAAAIAGIAPGVQSQGVWAGRRQLFVRFAAEAETAVLYTPEMLGRQMERVASQSPVHSIVLGGRDPLANDELILATLRLWTSPLPVMVECDGQRPRIVERVAECVAMVQVTHDFTGGRAAQEQVIESLAAAARAGREHALVLAPGEETSDMEILRLVRECDSAAPGTKIVVHPPAGAERGPLDRRYASLLEQATGLHRDTRLVMRVPAPVGGR